MSDGMESPFPIIEMLGLLSVTVVIVAPIAMLDGRFRLLPFDTTTKGGGEGREGSTAETSGWRPRTLKKLGEWWKTIRSIIILPEPPPGATKLASAMMLHELARHSSNNNTDDADGNGTPKRNTSFGALTQLSGRMTPQRKRRKMTLVLDLDETLIHAALGPGDPVRIHGGTRCEHDLRVDIRRDDSGSGSRKSFYVWKRPYLDLFLHEASKNFEIVIYTAGQQRYAAPLIDLVDLNCVVRRRLYRDACKVGGQGRYHKDLALAAGDHYPERALIVDNSPCAYTSTCPDNGVPIKPYFGNNPNDDELLCLLPFLNALTAVQDVRSVLKLRSDRDAALPGMLRAVRAERDRFEA
mmetsp:Transcript_90502/g.258506  ORF Transcript_90502/g.258506 Transcript_90502/m.258506 type:complete len:353 (-) Transcript_90502:253-1311(-)